MLKKLQKPFIRISTIAICAVLVACSSDAQPSDTQNTADKKLSNGFYVKSGQILKDLEAIEGKADQIVMQHQILSSHPPNNSPEEVDENAHVTISYNCEGTCFDGEYSIFREIMDSAFTIPCEKMSLEAKISLSKKRAEAGRKGGLKAKQKRENREIVTKKVNWLEYSFNKAHVKKMHEGYEILQELSKSGEPCNNSVFRYGGFVDFNFNPVAYIVAKYASVGVSSANDFKRRPNQGHAIHLWVKTFDKIIKAKTETLVLKSVFHNFYMQIVESRFKDGRYNFYAQKFLSLNYYSKTDFNNGNCKYDSVAVAHDRAISIGGNDSKYAQSWFSFLRLVRRVKGDLHDIKVEEERSGFYYSRLNNCYVETKSSVNKDRLKISGKVEPVKDPVKDPVKLMEEIAEVQIKQHVESNPKKEEEPLPYNVGEVDWDKALFGDDNNHEKK